MWGSSSVTSGSYPVLDRVGEVTLSPNGGPVLATDTVTLSTDTAGATLYYTTEEPSAGDDVTTWTAYTGPFTVSSGTVWVAGAKDLPRFQPRVFGVVRGSVRGCVAGVHAYRWQLHDFCICDDVKQRRWCCVLHSGWQ